MKLSAIWPLLKETFTHWNKDKAPRLAAAFSYYTMFSLAPLLIVVMGIAGLVFGQEAAHGELAGQIRGMVGPEAAKAIEGMISSARHPSSGVVATVLGIATLLLGAGGVFGQLQDALNTIWGVAPKPGQGFMEMVKARFLSFSMVLGTGFLLLVSLVLSALLSAAGKFVGSKFGGMETVLHIVEAVISFGVVTCLFALIYKVLPDAKVAWRDVWMAAVLTAVFFTIGKFAIGMYLGRSGVASAYGAAGSLVVLLLWVYYSAQILFFGAEFTKVYALQFGSRIVPARGAVPITPEARAEQGLLPSKSAAAVTTATAAAGMPPGPPLRPRIIEGLEGDIRRAGLIGAAVGLVVGLLRKPGPARRAH